MEDKFIVTYDCCSPDIPTLVVASKDSFDITIMNEFQGDEATTIYHLLRGDNNLTGILRKPIGDLNSVPHYRCPTCNSAVVMYCDDPKYPCRQWCGQKLDWNDDKSHETEEEILLVDDLFPNGYGIQHQKPLKISFKGEEE